MNSAYYIAVKKAKSAMKNRNRLGWPDTEDGILRLVASFDETERTVARMGRFVKIWDGSWKFSRPRTADVVEALEGRREVPERILFVEDEE